MDSACHQSDVVNTGWLFTLSNYRRTFSKNHIVKGRPVSNTNQKNTPLVDRIGRENLKIVDVKVTRLTSKPADGTYVHECGPVVLTKNDLGLLEIFTDQDLVGIGAEPVTVDDDFQYLIGKNPFDVEKLNLSAGADVACWDLIGKSKGQPLHQLLAPDIGIDPSVHVYASGGVMWTYYDRKDGQSFGVDALIEEALQYKELGFDTFKWRPGTDWEEAGVTPTSLGDICRQLREAVGPQFNLGLEKKGYDSWTYEQCLEIAPIINELKYLFFEQPMGDVGPAQFDDYLKLKEKMPEVMLWGGESLKNLQEIRPWLENGVYDAIQIDATRQGFSEDLRIADVAKQNKVKVVPHNWYASIGTAANLHLTASVEAGFMCEFFMYPSGFRYNLLKDPPKPENGRITLSKHPGLGIDVIDDVEKHFPYEPGPNTFANPRFPHAWDRAKEREKAVYNRYVG